MENVLAIILAGGRGERLSILAEERTKPAIPFAGKYRIIDFTLSNCANSGIYNVAVLTQYQPLSLIDHIGIGTPWDLDGPGRTVRVVQAYLAGRGRGWYKGTADAVYQNLAYIEQQGVELVLILSGDHIYGMDYSDMVKTHQESKADVTLAVTPMPEEELSRFGTVTVDEQGQIAGFQEKVKRPQSNLASMGVYLFNKEVLRQCLEEDAQSITSRHDFGRDILPRLINKVKSFAHTFKGYWRDVGTVHAYWQANMDLLGSVSPLFNAKWSIHTKEEERPPAFVSETASVNNSLIASGCIIEGQVEHSVLFPGVRIAKGAVVNDSVIMSDSIIGANGVIDYSILDKEVVIGAGSHIGHGDDFQVNRKQPKVVDTGITVVGKRAKVPTKVKIGRNCVIHCAASKNDFPAADVQSGETIELSKKT